MNRCTKNGFRISGAALFASLLLSQAAFAQSPRSNVHYTFESVSETITIGGLDVSTQAGASRLYREIVSTAKRICWSSVKGIVGVARAKHERDFARPCFDAAVSGALAQVAAQTGTDLEQVAGLDRFVVAGLMASR